MLALGAAPARADQKVALEMPGLEVVVPDDWTYVGGVGIAVFADAAGAVIGRLRIDPAPCAQVTARLALEGGLEPGGPIVDPEPGWSGARFTLHGEPIAVYCRTVAILGTSLSAVMEGFHDDRGTLLRAYGVGLDAVVASFGATPEPGAGAPPPPVDPLPPTRPTLLGRLRPQRYELGITMLDVGTDDFLTSERGAGANLEIAAPLYGAGLALGYRARLQPTSVGMAGFAEANVGLAVKYLRLAAIAGVGGAGRSAPFGIHYGGEADLLIPLGFVAGFEASASYAWCTGGRTTRIDGRVFVKPWLLSRRGFSFGIGWEQRVDSRIITINGGVMRVPDL